MSFWKRLVERVRLGLFLTASTTCWALSGPASSRRKNGTPSAPTARPLEELTKEEMLKEAGFKSQLSVPSAAISTPPARKNGVTSSVRAMAEKLVYEDTARIQFALTTPIYQGGVQFWDPQCDMPLDEGVEMAIQQMTPAVYLRWVCREYKIDFNPMPETEHACLRAARKAVRNIPEFTGERFIQ